MTLKREHFQKSTKKGGAMFYKELYPELGKLFYYIAAVDGKVQPAERESLQRLIHSTWEPLEDSVDEFGTDRAVLIDASFDYEESENFNNNGLQSFEEFYKENKTKFTPTLINNILKTGKAIASAYYGKNKDEQAVLEKIEKLLRD
ncbi:MAG: hypothetical protein ABI237_16425 [Ginsengibacter sp.]